MAGTWRLASHLSLFFCSLVSPGHLLRFSYWYPAKIVWVNAPPTCVLPPGAGLAHPAYVSPPFFVTLMGLFALWVTRPVCGCYLPLLSYSKPCGPLQVALDAPSRGEEHKAHRAVSWKPPMSGRTAMTSLNEVWSLQVPFLSHLLADPGTLRPVWSRSVCTAGWLPGSWWVKCISWGIENTSVTPPMLNRESK